MRQRWISWPKKSLSSPQPLPPRDEIVPGWRLRNNGGNCPTTITPRETTSTDLAPASAGAITAPNACRNTSAKLALRADQLVAAPAPAAATLRLVAAQPVLSGPPAPLGRAGGRRRLAGRAHRLPACPTRQVPLRNCVAGLPGFIAGGLSPDLVGRVYRAKVRKNRRRERGSSGACVADTGWPPGAAKALAVVTSVTSPRPPPLLRYP